MIGPCPRLAAVVTAVVLGTTGCASAGVPPATADLGADGPFTVLSYTDFPDVPEFGDATIYYPVGTPGPIGGVVIAPGYTERQSHIEWWGPRLASHGYAVLVLDTNDPREEPAPRAAALLAGVRLLRAEGTRAGGRLLGRIAPDRMAVMGHSMGGGGALRVAAEHGEEIRAAIPFTPWEPAVDLARVAVPTLIIAGEADRIADVGEHAWRLFRAIPASTPKVYMEVAGGDHFIADTNRGGDLSLVGRYSLAWLRLHLDGDERLRPFLFGHRTRRDAEKLSRYVARP